MSRNQDVLDIKPRNNLVLNIKPTIINEILYGDIIDIIPGVNVGQPYGLLLALVQP